MGKKQAKAAYFRAFYLETYSTKLYLYSIQTITPYQDYKALYEQQLQLNKEQAATIEKLTKTAEEQALTITSLQLQVANLQKMLFGSKKDIFKPTASNTLQGTLFDVPAIAEVVVENKKKITYERGTQKIQVAHKGRNPLPTHLRREVIELQPVEDVSGLTAIGEEVTEVLEYQQGELYVKQYKRKEYLQPSSDGLHAKRIIATLPSLPIEKGIAGPSLCAHLLVSKYVDHLPIHRQVQIFKRDQVAIDESTICNWFKKLGGYLETLYEAHRQQVFTTNYLAADETHYPVLDKNKKGTTHKGYYWVYQNLESGDVLFEYQQGRSGDYATQALQGYSGYLLTDGYAGYDAVAANAAITRLNCWAHARRKFIEVQDMHPAVVDVLQTIGHLYTIEQACKDSYFTPTQIKEKRQTASVPLLKELYQQLVALKASSIPNTPLNTAINYSLNRWKGLNIYTYDGTLPIDNNLLENKIRPIALGRKNYLFAGNHEAAQRSAILYSLFATCKQHNVNPTNWLTFALTNIAQHPINKIQQLLPKNYTKIS